MTLAMRHQTSKTWVTDLIASLVLTAVQLGILEK